MKKHFTATAYIAAKLNKEYKILLHKHKKHGLWIGIGGHIEEDENPTEAVLREVKEETNLDIKLIKNKLLKIKGVEELVAPVAILQEKLLAFKDEPAHFHIDLIYFAICKNPNKLKMDGEFGWFSLPELKSAKLNKEVLYFALKILKYF